ncbi:EAL domain-containing protein [Aliivibrio finisterrensis]|uniref:EAL and HDOD domain-containing protein n=1 Tax=Aliivibrio finisterrensis TaxID=511998 RepID=UPI00101F6045|nr:EAL domain-containing protein [Aliivibrio finisterrensis]RYU64383.1 EAL domain-containing protein [Aliivibrio finisterrensis]RYU67778.1 EAL domain-containing protein [Aliivibrio finisterrensis]RYU70808.1 EAL domain-containing protein [Aliivibrio finisterrensis]
MYSYVARQPILDLKKNTIGYELLFRDGPKNTFPAVEAEAATSRLLSDHFLSSQCNATNDKLGFVNFPHQSLINLVPTLFSANNLVVEILEDCIPNQELLNAIKTLSERGYKLALDDFEPNPLWTPFLPYIDIIKFDIRTIPILKAKLFIRHCEKYNITFLAEKVETYEEFEQAKAAGFTYFQGYFFSKPEMLQQRAIQPNQLSIMQLYQEISAPIVDFNAVEKYLVQDVSLSYKLLRFVNASSIIDKPITSFKQALVYLGETKLRQFISLVAVAHATQHKPQSLYTLSIHRAKLCELIVTKTNIKLEPSQAFLVGLFSLLEPLLDQPLNSLIQHLPISIEIKLALTERKGPLGMLILAIESYEKANWNVVSKCCATLKITEEEFTNCYKESAEWVDDMEN